MLLILIAVTVLYTSCTKDDSKIDPDPDTSDSVTIMGFKDSTLLIKGISSKGINYSGNYIGSDTAYLYSGSVYIYYDTLNRKININTEYTTSPTPTPNSAVISYNKAGLIIQYDATNTEWSYINYYTYDAQNVLSSATMISEELGKEAFYFTKKMLTGGGYSLSTKDSFFFQEYNEIDLYTFNFNADNQLTLMSSLSFPSLDKGFIDSIYYDTFGNIRKVTEISYKPGNVPSNVTLFEFTSRNNKGDQYYNFNKIVFNGIAGFPDLFGNFAAGSPIAGLYNRDLFQFTKYPAVSTKLYEWDPWRENGAYFSFTPDAEYDSKNRLVKFKSYLGDKPCFSKEYHLTYYK